VAIPPESGIYSIQWNDLLGGTDKTQALAQFTQAGEGDEACKKELVMGFESILVSFHGYTGTPADLARSLDQLIRTAPDPAAAMTSQAKCWVLDDGQHKFEVEAGPEPTVFHLRFALCNPRSIDPVFFLLMKTLMREYRLKLRFCEDCEDVPEWFVAPEMIDSSKESIQRCLDLRREQWHQEFGDEELPATEEEAFQRFILPRAENAPQQRGTEGQF
jgi:hypothetical protein